MRIFILCLLVSIFIPNANASGKTTADEIRSAALTFLKDFSVASKADGLDVEYSLGRIDSRLNLAPCPEVPDVSFSSDPFATTHPTLLVACTGKRPWRLFVSAELRINGPGLVASRPLSRGARVSEDMITEQSITLNASRSAVITDREALSGMELRRSISAGTAFTARLLNEPDAVARGDHVVIVARAGSIAVESRGKALADGKLGEQVAVRNLASSRTLRAQVVARGRVEVPM